MNIPRSISQPRKTSSLLHQVKARYNSYEYSSFYKPVTQNKFAFTPGKNALIIIINIPRSISQPRKTSSLLHQVKARYNSYEYSSVTPSRNAIRQTVGPLVPMVGLVPIEKDVIPVVLSVNMHLIKGTLIIFPCDLAGYRAIPMVHWYQWYVWYQWKTPYSNGSIGEYVSH